MMMLATAAAQMPGMGGEKTKAPVMKADLKFIRCATCEELAKTLHRDVKTMRDELPAHIKKLPEIDIIERVENVCDPEKTAGEWITHLDMLEDGDKIKLVYHEAPSKCESECRTIAKACEEVMGDSDTDLAEAMYKGDMQRAKLTNLLCHDLADVCTSKPPKVPKTRKPGPAFVEMDEEEIRMQQMMASMKDMPGMPGMNMYSRDDLAGMMDGAYDADDEEDYGAYGGAYGGGDDEGAEPPEPGLGAAGVKLITEGLDAVGNAISAAATKLVGLASDLLSGGKKGDQPEL